MAHTLRCGVGARAAAPRTRAQRRRRWRRRTRERSLRSAANKNDIPCMFIPDRIKTRSLQPCDCSQGPQLHARVQARLFQSTQSRTHRSRSLNSDAERVLFEHTRLRGVLQEPLGFTLSVVRAVIASVLCGSESRASAALQRASSRHCAAAAAATGCRQKWCCRRSRGPTIPSMHRCEGVYWRVGCGR